MLNILDLMRQDGLQPKRKAAVNGGEYCSPCPMCGGKDRFLAWPEKGNKGGKWWCRGCEKGGDCEQYLQDVRGMSFPEAKEFLEKGYTSVKPTKTKTRKPEGGIKQAFPGKKTYKTPDKSLTDKYYEALWKNEETLSYLQGRGFSTETIKRFKLGYCERDKEPCVSIPHFEAGTLVNIKFRYIRRKKDNKFARIDGCRSILFNADILKGRKEIFITEGEFDGISLIQAGIENVISSTCGSATFHPEWIDQVEDIEKIYICYDADKAGSEGARNLAKRLGYGRCFNIELPEGMDLNDYFLAGNTIETFGELVEQARRFDLPGIISMETAIDILLTTKETGDDKGLVTQWPSVNHLLLGFHPGDLIVVSALPKTGKTSFCLDISRFLAMADIPVLFYCLEMRPERLVDKFIQCQYRKPKKDLRKSDYELAKVEFAGLPLYFSHFFQKKADDVLDLIRDAVKRYNLKLVIFDNVHYLVRNILHINEELGQAVQGFKLLAEEMEIPVILIAQPRKRENTGRNQIMTAEDIKYSNSIHADCDQMIILYRKRLASKAGEIEKDDFSGKEAALDPVTLIRIEAHRYGAGGETLLYFHGEYSRFDPVERKGN